MRPPFRPRRTGPPDYVGVGSPWTGVPWWHGALLKHPQVEPRRRSRRALGFFQEFCERSMDDSDVRAYHERFPRRPGRLAGEWSPRYLLDFWTPPLLHRAAPDAKILLLVADPVARYREKLANELRRRPAEQAAYYMSEMLPRSRYATHLHGLWRHFDPEQTLVLQYERCLLDPAAEYARMVRFLGLDDGFEPFSRLRTRITTAVWRLTRRRLPDVDLWPELEQPLRAELEEEVSELARLVPDLDLTLWPGFADLASGRATAAPERV